MKIREYLHYLANCKSVEELWDAHCAKMSEYGFDRLIYGFTRYRTERSLGDPEDFVLLTNHGSEFVDGFIKRGLYFHAPMVRWALENEGAGSWRMIREDPQFRPQTKQEFQLWELNEKLGISAGYTISFKALTTRSKGAIALTARRGMSQDEVDATWQEHGRDIHLVNNIANLKIITLPYAPPHRSLTKRQREALEWVGDGKTAQDIALLMGLTTATVEKHLRLARECLSVETTAQAVLKAAFHNQMFVVDA